MDIQLLQAVGGLGLFLLGMTMLTDGLRSLAGNALRQRLRSHTRSPLSGATTGAVATAILQSSSATTVAAVGFVGAGLISFPNALGVIFGANIGTTVTGWLVAILGFKLHLGTIVTPLVLVGALTRLFGRGRWQHVGWALAGFSLLFVGIDAMQQGMSVLKDVVSPSVFPGDTFFGRLQLVCIGIAITIVTQSSSAGVAVALAALSSATITFPQAAAMVIGMDVGTTFTAALATLGGSTATRRTGFAHVIYNILTGMMAFMLLTPLGWLVQRDAFVGIDPQLALVAFHSFFNLLGVLLILGVTNQFAALVVRLVPDRGPRLTARLDRHLISDTAGTIEALSSTVSAIAHALFKNISEQLSRQGPATSDLRAIAEALETTKQFSEQVSPQPDNISLSARRTSIIHTMDHLLRLLHRAEQQNRIDTIVEDAELSGVSRKVASELDQLSSGAVTAQNEGDFDRLRTELREARRTFRDRAIAQGREGDTDLDELMNRMDAIRWLHRVSYHVWRIVHHMRLSEGHVNTPEKDDEALLDVRED